MENHTTMAASSAAGALHSEDEREGILVKRRPDEDWKPATKEEAEELRRHDLQLQEEEAAQARADAAALSSLEAARAREWEDWAMESELRGVPDEAGPRKRVRAVVTMTTSRGAAVARGVVEGDVLRIEEVMLTFALQESSEAPGHREGTADELLVAPTTPSTVLIPETQMEQQVQQMQEVRAQGVDLDSFMCSKEGGAAYQQWVASGKGLQLGAWHGGTGT